MRRHSFWVHNFQTPCNAHAMNPEQPKQKPPTIIVNPSAVYEVMVLVESASNRPTIPNVPQHICATSQPDRTCPCNL